MVICVNVGILAIGVTAIRQVAANAPALSSDLRVEPEDLGWRPSFRPALYDKSLYYAERSFAFLDPPGDDAPSPDDLLAAVALALDAVESSPADAYHWTSLAIATEAAGLNEMSRTAFARSAVLAPYNANLALQRLSLFRILHTPLDDVTRQIIERDLATADRYARGALRGILEAMPEITEAVPPPPPPEEQDAGAAGDPS